MLVRLDATSYQDGATKQAHGKGCLRGEGGRRCFRKRLRVRWCPGFTPTVRGGKVGPVCYRTTRQRHSGVGLQRYRGCGGPCHGSPPVGMLASELTDRGFSRLGYLPQAAHRMPPRFRDGTGFRLPGEQVRRRPSNPAAYRPCDDYLFGPIITTHPPSRPHLQGPREQ